MSAITYTAKRNLVPSGFDVTATDLSIASVDNSINSVTTDLLGLLASDYILLTGSAVDDGWHEVYVDSTATKIELLSSLTDEAAGSVINIVGYKHGLSVSYNLETGAQALTPSYPADTKAPSSLSGVTETLLFAEHEDWDITTSIITEAEYPYWREFFSSVRAGESFAFDPYGTIAAPDEVKTCRLVGDYTVQRQGSSRRYRFVFKVRVK